MSAAGAAGGAVQAGVGIFQIAESRRTARALERQAEFEAERQEFNATMIRERKKDLRRITEDKVRQRQRSQRGTVGAQRAIAAAQGIDVESEVVAELAQDEQMFAQEDILNIKADASRLALGIELEADELETSARFTRLKGLEASRRAKLQGTLSGISNIAGGASRVGGFFQTRADNRAIARERQRRNAEVRRQNEQRLKLLQQLVSDS